MRRYSVVLLSLLGAGCVPWTVVGINDDVAPISDAAAYVESVWSSQLLPAAERGIPVEEARRRSASVEKGAFLVVGRGTVLQVESGSPGGRILVDLEPADGVADLAVLTGPVILGTAVRDAAGFINFSDFPNQLAYADVAIELNRRVVEDVLADMDLTGASGKTIEFRGAWQAIGSGLDVVVPLWLEMR